HTVRVEGRLDVMLIDAVLVADDGSEAVVLDQDGAKAFTLDAIDAAFDMAGIDDGDGVGVDALDAVTATADNAVIIADDQRVRIDDEDRRCGAGDVLVVGNARRAANIIHLDGPRFALCVSSSS